MSRGPGVRQRAILTEVEAKGFAWVTLPDMAPAEKVARRRAARALERDGLATLTAWRGEKVGACTVALPPGWITDHRTVVGGDGKRYRARAGDPQWVEMVNVARAHLRTLDVEVSEERLQHFAYQWRWHWWRW